MILTDFIFSNAFILLFLPIWVAFLLTLNFTVPSFRSKRFTSNLTLISTGICAIYSACLLFMTAATGTVINNDVISWIDVSGISFEFGFLLDNLAALFLFLLTTISFFVQLYSREQMENDECYHRYFVYLNLFNFALSGFFVSSNLVQSYIFLSLTTVCIYLLTGFWFKKESVSTSAQKIFSINAFADSCFLLVVVTLLYFALNYLPDSDFSLLNFAVLYELAQNIIPYISELGFCIICMFLIIGIMVKAAQFPFHVWLAESSEAPISACALINSVVAGSMGIYLLVRLLPVFNIHPVIMQVILYAGIFTALFCSFIAIFQRNIKKLLSYLMSAQTSVAIASVGLASVSEGVFLIVITAFAQVLLFLLAGLIISVYDTEDIKYMGALRSYKPLLAGIYVAAVLSASGLFFSGVFPKVQVLNLFLEKGMFLQYALILSSFVLIAFGYFKSYFDIFEGKSGEEDEQKLNLVKLHLPVKFSLGIFALLVICLGFLANSNFSKLFEAGLKTYLSIKSIVLYIFLVSFALGFAYLFNKYKVFEKYLPRCIDKFLSEGLCIDKFYVAVVKYIYEPVCKGLSYFDKYVIDGFVKLVGFLVKIKAVTVSKLQNGNLQSYLFGSFLGILLALLLIVFYYLKIKGFSDGI